MIAANDELTEAQQIERALAELVMAIGNSPSVPWPAIHGRGITFAQATSAERTKAEEAAGDLLDDPVGEALRQAISTLGVRLHEIGGAALMLEVAYRVNEPHQHSMGTTYLDIMDKRWDGIGAGSADGGWWS